MKQKSAIYVMIGLAVLGALAGLWAALASAPKVSVSSVRRGDISIAVDMAAQVVAGGTYSIAPATTGTVTEVFVREGQDVSAGQKLFALDGAEVEQALKEARLELDIAKREQQSVVAAMPASVEASAQMEEAQTVAAAYKNLDQVLAKAQSASVDYEEFTQAVEVALLERESVEVMAQQPSGQSTSNEDGALKVAEAKVALAAEKVAGLENKLEQLTYKSSMDGRVLQSALKVGETVRLGEAIMTIGDARNMAVQGKLGASQLDGVAPGQKARLSVGGSVYTGRVAQKDSALGVQDGEPAATLSIQPDAGFNAPVGSVVSAQIILAESQKALLLPLDCLAEDENGEWVFVAVDGKLERRTVRTGLRDELNVEIKSGLNEGEKVVFNPQSAILMDGQTVRVLE